MPRINRLHQELAERIVQMIRDEGLARGARLNENSIAKSLNVSRTPVRAAFAQLAKHGIVRRDPNKGLEIVEVPATTASTAEPDEIEGVMVRISHDRQEQLLDDEVTEAEIMRRYDLARPDAQKVLNRLAELDLLERKLGHGWRFNHGPRDHNAHLERYRFRMAIEPAALLEPGFALDRGWSAEIRARHQDVLEQPWRDSGAVAFYEMNAEFHEGLAKASGNRYFHNAVRRQNELRRMSNYDWTFGVEPVRLTCREHLQILDYLNSGEREVASLLMRRHLERASTLRTQPA